MKRLLLCIFVLCSQAPPAGAQALALPSGFIRSQLVDPVSGLPVQLAVSRKPGAPWVVLIHGLGQTASLDWVPVLPALAAQYQVLLFDLPGFGNSAAPDSALTPTMFADLVHWLVAQHTDQPVAVVGHSLGGAIALRYSIAYPQQVQRLLLIDAAGILEKTVFARYLSRVPDHIDQAPALDGLVHLGSAVLNHLSGQLQDLMADSASGMTAFAGSDRARGMLYQDKSQINAALGLVNEDFSPKLRDLTMPVRLLWGANDPVAPVRTALALTWLLPQAQLDILPKAGHGPINDDADGTVAWLLRALGAAAPEQKASVQTPSQGDGRCKKQQHLVFRGKWRSLQLDRCDDVVIEDADIGKLSINRGSVTLTHVTINATGVGLEATDASITATGLRIVAAQALRLDHSRLDLAGFDVVAPLLGQEKNDSRLFFSLGRWCDGGAEWRLHGAFKPRAGELDGQFRLRQDAPCHLEVAPGQE